MDKGLTKLLAKQQFKGILLKLGVAAPNHIIDALCLRYRPGKHITRTKFDSHSSTLKQVDQDGDLVEYNRFIKDLACLFPLG